MVYRSPWTWTTKFIASTTTTVCSHRNVLAVEQVGLFCMCRLEMISHAVFLLSTTGITPVEGTEETVRVVSMDKDFHVDCYICEECGMQLTDESDKRCYPYEGRLMCRSCHLQKLAMQAPNSRVAEPVCATYQYMG